MKIHLGNQDYDPITGTLTSRKEDKTANQIFLEVKRIRHDLICAYNITDDELKTIITKVKSGIRNTYYLAPGDANHDYRRLYEIAAYIVREYSY